MADMASLVEWSLWLHIAAGTVALVAGLGALVATKGGRRHRQAGKGFLGAMAIVVATVFLLVAIEPTTLRIILALVAAFSGYLAFSGYRLVGRKRPSDSPHVIDWTAALGVVLASLLLGGWGLSWVVDGRTFGLAMTVFGGIGVAFGTLDLRSFRQGSTGEWMVSHLQRMVGAVIATVSAVTAVNLTPLLGVSAWLLPTAVGVPLIVYWSKKYGSD